MDTQKDGAAFGVGLVLVTAVLWGTVGPAQVLASSPMTPAALGGWRLLAGGLVLGVFTVRPKTMRILAAPTIVRPLLVCALSTSVYQAAFLGSVARTGAALATVVALGTAPVATGLCARWVTGERMGPAWSASTVAAVAGCGLLLAPGGSRVDPLGLFLAVAAGTCYGLYTVSAKQLATTTTNAHLPALSALSLLVGSLPLLPWMINGAAAMRDGATLGLIAWLGVVTTAAAYWLFTLGLSRVRATTAGTLSLAEPLAAALIGALLLHERLSASAWAGCALILLGMVTTCLPSLTRGRSSVRATHTARNRRTTFAGHPEQPGRGEVCAGQSEASTKS
ncbi:DMT family transporter [Streptomyces albus subsp. chlorinus]|uniref:DMT family transporter n=1 Tax=Streptomyces albus TaxID=1888 RepID=UPI00156FEE88|nr:DMT family transporter [Streptomyces albus]NSC19890.1 DMT family transporter [Streptomyces albus subsp. chlorinus]